MRLFICFFLVILNVQAVAQKDILTQFSTIDALLSGVYEGDLTLGELKRYGDFGLGTFNGLEGEMFFIHGCFFQVISDGTVKTPPINTKTPFAVVTSFEEEQVIDISSPMNFNTLEKTIDNHIPTYNIFYAIQVEGTFQKVKTRSVPKQQPPYQPLINIVEKQPIFNFDSVRGIMVGFRCPPYIKGINVPGYHLHFLTEDNKAGGHVLDFTIQKAVVKLDYIPGFSVLLPKNEKFYQVDLSTDKESELKK